MSKKLPYCVSFDTKDMAPRIKAVRVDLSIHIMRDMNEQVRVDHPQLYAYCVANPPEKKS